MNYLLHLRHIWDLIVEHFRRHPFRGDDLLLVEVERWDDDYVDPEIVRGMSMEEIADTWPNPHVSEAEDPENQ